MAYASSAVPRPTATPRSRAPRSPLEARPDVRSQVNGLGGAWLILGLISLGATAFLLYSSEDPRQMRAVAGYALLMGTLGVFWITLGIGAFLKKLWSIQGGLVLGYISIAIGLVSLVMSARQAQAFVVPSFLPFIIQLAIIRQAHRVLGSI